MTVIRKAEGIRLQWRTILANINKALDGTVGATPDALMYAVLPIFEKSQHYCPVKTGRLKRSGFCRQKAAAGRSQAKVEIGYAEGGDPHYAFIVHEDMTARHEGDTRAKFLQSAIDEGKDDIIPRVADYLRGGGAGGSQPKEVKGG
jgi:hypothetical protein